MASNEQNYYSNPAFCQQSEFYNSPRRRALSPERRHPPVGAHKPLRSEDYYQDQSPKIGPKPSVQRRQSIKSSNQHQLPNVHKQNHGMPVQMQISNTPAQDEEFGYDEMLVDDSFRHKQEGSQNYQDSMNGNLMERNPRCVENRNKHRYEYIPMQEQEKSPTRRVNQENVVSGRIHRYATIPTDDKIDSRTRYALVPIEDIENGYLEVNKNRYEYIPDCYEDGEVGQVTPKRILPPRGSMPIHVSPKRVLSPQTPRKANPVATQKLHELLTTPRKGISTPKTHTSPVSPPASRRMPISPISPISPQLSRNVKAQKTLNYAISTRQALPDTKRHTAVIAPICSSPVQSVYSETTFSNKTASWMNVSSVRGAPIQATIAVAAIMMVLCGSLTSALCFYMVSVVGRMYYLDFGIVSGFACLLLGLLGFRSRNCHWLPNRNFISGYIVLSAFSLLTCAGLLILLFLQPKPGSPLADVTSGAVCGISGLSLFLASAGVVASYCCRYPPPDNRVQHCARGFTV